MQTASKMSLLPRCALPLLLALGALICGADEVKDSAAEPPPATAQQITDAIHRGVQFLIKDQNKDGSWGSAHQTKDLNIFAPVPSAHQAFRAAVTSMCVEGLIASGLWRTNDSVLKSLERGEAWLLEHLPKVRRADGVAIYNVWTHAYGIQALVAMHERQPEDIEHRKTVRELIYGQIDRLRRYESVDGGWGYYDFRVQTQRPSSDSISFVTATVLIAFHRAREIGVIIPDDMRQRAFDSIQRQRKSDHSYFYGEYLKMRPMMPINRPGGSLGRSQSCSLALRLWGDETITVAVLEEWLEKLITRNGWLDMGRKRPVPHESWFQVAGYFYYYGHYYAALCADHLEGARRGDFKARLAGLLVPLQEKDGTWWDYPLYNYHQQYGTAYALMTLVRCQPED